MLQPSAGKVTVDPIHSSKVVVVAPVAQSKLEEVATLELAPLPIMPFGTYANDYVAGQCTALAASMVKVPNSMGNANAWASVASSLGYTVSNVPIVGAVAQTTFGWAGHVAIVEEIDGDLVKVIEQNYQGAFVIDERWSHVSEWQYIYF